MLVSVVFKRFVCLLTHEVFPATHAVTVDPLDSESLKVRIPR